MLIFSGSSYDWWLTPSVVLGIHLFQLEARIEHARLKNGALVFRFPILFRFGLLFAAGALLYLDYRDWSGEELWIRIAGLLMGLTFLVCWPPTVVLSKAGIERRSLWKPRLFIPWNEIVDAEINGAKDMTVFGTNATIHISRFQNDPDRFRREILARASIKKFSSPEQTLSLHL